MFLKHNHLPQRFYKPVNEPTQLLTIGETGFGTGLNFLVTLYCWQKIIQPKHSVHYISVEKFPFNKAQLTQIYSTFIRQWPQLQNLCTLLLDAWPDSIPDQSVFEYHFSQQAFKLTLLTGDAQEQFEQQLKKQPTSQHLIDIWYLDGFAPSKNPGMWSQKLFNTLYSLSKPGTTLSTFTVAGFVRRGLIEAGFNISKTPGTGKKRENLTGRYPV